jgi:2-oxo-3-hexenedioate decarboxylase
VTDPIAVARELHDAYANRRLVPTPSSQDDRFDIAAAYAVERELARMRSQSGHTAVGRKVGFANKAMWRVLKLDTLVWARMYDDTIHDAPSGETTISIARMVSPKIEPEIVVRLKAPLQSGEADAAAALEAVEWIALGFEIIDCVYPDWKFQPADFVAAYGLHAGLVVGAPRRVDAASIPQLVEQLPAFKVRLVKNGQLVEEGSGKNALRSPALCLAELASAVARQSGAEPLAAGELVSTGTLTNSAPIARGDTWRAEVDGLDLQPLTVRVS